MEKCLYFWLNYIEECSTLSFSVLWWTFQVCGAGRATGHLLATYWSCCCILCVGTGCIAWHIAVYYVWELVTLPDMLPFFCRWRVQVATVCLLPSRHPWMFIIATARMLPTIQRGTLGGRLWPGWLNIISWLWPTKGVTLMAKYGLEEENEHFKGPLSYKQYLQHVLQHCFWGDEIILYAISCMWNLRITVLNSRTLEEYQIQHSFSLADADVGIIYNCVNHYSAAGECWPHWWLHHFICIRKLVALLVTSLYLYQETGHIAGLLVWSHEWSTCYISYLFQWSPGWSPVHWVYYIL